MMRFERILCPVDFSDFSELAVRYAVSLAAQYDSRLILLHSIPDPVLLAGFSGTIPPYKYDWTVASESMDHLSNRLIPIDIPVEKREEVGSPARTILKIAEEEDCDLIVMGTHGLSGFEAFLIGSVTNKVLHKAKIPVLVVCRQKRDFLTGNPDHPIQINQILCAVAPDTSAVKMTRLALSIAKQFQARILFYQVLQSGISGLSMTSPLASIKEIITPEDMDWCDVRFATEKGDDPVVSILKAAEENHTDLLFVGHHVRRPAALEALGSVALKVIRESSCPVTVVREV